MAGLRALLGLVALGLFFGSSGGAGADLTLPPGFSESQIAAGLSSPSSLVIAPDGRVFVCQQDGNIWILKNDTLLSVPFATLNVDDSGERGLLGIALDPEFPSNPYVYVYYTASLPASHNRLSRLTANGDTAVAGSETILVELPEVGTGIYRMGGSIQFALDGTLFLSVGDYQTSANAQSLDVLPGKILRLNKDGTIPGDNPFYNQATGINRAIWALGLRNPYTTAIQPGTGRFFINDVGQTSWEEINSGSPGANFGWPLTEGDFDQASHPNFTRPIYAYPNWVGCAITGGAFYNPATNQFPAQYLGKYFFQDFCNGSIEVLDPVSFTVTNFSSGASYPTDLQIAPNGSLYYLARGAATGGLAMGLGTVHKIQYVLNTPPTITLQPEDQFVSVGQGAEFVVSAIGSLPLHYQWQRNGVNLPGANSPSYMLSSASTTDNGTLFRCVVTNAYGSDASSNATLTVTTNKPPLASITAPASGIHYNGGDTISFAGYGMDPERGLLSATNLTWQVDFMHNQHAHPFYPPNSGLTNGTFTIPVAGETSTNVWFRIYLTVRDSVGLTDTAIRDVLPNTATITIDTSPAGLVVEVDGQPQPTPLNVAGVVGLTRTLGAFLQTSSGGTYSFDHWSDGGSATHTISFPPTNVTYTAFYRVASPGDYLAGWYRFDEGAGSMAADASPSANNGLLQNGPGWVSGKIGGAISFDGSDDFVRVGTDLSHWLGSGDASLCAWLKTTQVGDDTVWLAPGLTGVEAVGSTNDIFWGWLDAGGRVGISAGNGPAAKSSLPINNGQWHHVALTRNAETGEVKVYVDGSLNATVSSEAGPKTTPFTSFGRIENTGGTPVYFAGQIDDLRLYASVLSASDVQAIMNSAPSVTAGSNQTIALPSSATLSGAYTDDGLPNPPGIVSVLWGKVSGPGNVTFDTPTATNSIARFSLPGTYILSLTANDGALASSNLVTVLVNDTYSAWAARYAVGSELTDPDADGLNNLLEYGLGLNPVLPDRSSGPKAALESNHLTLSYTRAKTATDLTFTVEASSSVAGGWSSAGLNTQLLSDNGLVQTFKTTDPVLISANTARFVRLKISRQ